MSSVEQLSVESSTSDGPADNVRHLHDRRAEMRRIDAELDDVAGHLNAQHGRLIDLTVWLLDHPAEWSGEGVWKPEQFLAWRCGIGVATAAKVVALAERAAELPATIDAVRSGELSLDQALPIAKRVPAWAEERVASLARRLTVRQIQRTVATYPFGDGPLDATAPPDTTRTNDASNDDASEDEAADSARCDEDTAIDNGPSTEDSGDGRDAAEVAPGDRCWWGHGDDGRWRMYVETSRDVGDVIGSALDEALDACFRRDGAPATGVDALAEVATRSLDAIESPSRRDRVRINMHLHTDGRATDHVGVPLPDAIRRHLTCDGLVTPVFLEHGMPVSVGRSERIVPERTRRIVLLRDGGCRVPGCHAEHHLDIHHIVHWSDHGPSDTWNLIALCPRHHRAHHHGKLGITGNADEPDGVVFSRADGTPIRPSGASPNPSTGPPPPIPGSYEHPVGGRLDTSCVGFHPPATPLRRRNTS